MHCKNWKITTADKHIYLRYLHFAISDSMCVRLKCVCACVQCQTTMDPEWI